MITRFLSIHPAYQSTQPKTVRTLTSDRPRTVLSFPTRTPVAAAVVAALLLGASLPVAQHAGAQVESARGWMERAETPGDESITIEVDGTELPAGAPIVSEDAITVPYDPNVQEQIEPFDPRAEEQVEPASGPGGGTAPD